MITCAAFTVSACFSCCLWLGALPPIGRAVPRVNIWKTARGAEGGILGVGAASVGALVVRRRRLTAKLQKVNLLVVPRPDQRRRASSAARGAVS